MVKKEVTQPTEIFEKMRPLLDKFKGVVHDELSKGLAPIRDIRHHIDLISRASISNLSHHDKMNLQKSEVLKEKIEELIQMEILERV